MRTPVLRSGTSQRACVVELAVGSSIAVVKHSFCRSRDTLGDKQDLHGRNLLQLSLLPTLSAAIGSAKGGGNKAG